MKCFWQRICHRESNRSQTNSPTLSFFLLFDGFKVQQIYQTTLLLLLNFIVVKILLFKTDCVYLKSVLHKPRTCTVAMCVAADFTTVYKVHVCSLFASCLRQLIISYRHPNEDNVRTADMLSFYVIENMVLP